MAKAHTASGSNKFGTWSKIWNFITGNDGKPRCLQGFNDRYRIVAYCQTRGQYQRLLRAAKAKGYNDIRLNVNPLVSRASEFPLAEWRGVIKRAEGLEVWNGAAVPHNRLPCPSTEHFENLSGVVLSVDAVRKGDNQHEAATEKEIDATVDAVSALLDVFSYVLIQSGNGVHAYLPIDPLPLDPEQNLRNWAQSLGKKLPDCKIDHLCSGALQSIRIPGFLNTSKEENPQAGRVHRKASLVRIKSNDRSVTALTKIIRNAKATGRTRSTSKSSPMESVPKKGETSYRKLLGEKAGCHFFRHCWDNPTDIDYPLWYCLANLCTHLPNGNAIFHRLSRLDASRYDHDKAEVVFQEARTSQKHPTLCRHLGSISGESDTTFSCPEVATCPYRTPAEYKPSCSAKPRYSQSYHRNPVADFGDLKERETARDTVQKCVVEACHASPGTVTVVNALVGIGKTQSLCKGLRRKKAIYLGPSHRQCAEAVTVFRENGLDAVHLLGPNRDDCPPEHFNEIRSLQKKGAPYKETYCKKKCSKRKKCLILRQSDQELESAKVLCAPVQHIQQNPNFFSRYGNKSRRVIIFDEDPSESLRPLHRLTHRALIGLQNALKRRDRFVQGSLKKRALNSIQAIVADFIKRKEPITVGKLRSRFKLPKFHAFRRRYLAYSDITKIESEEYRKSMSDSSAWSNRKAISSILALFAETEPKHPIRFKCDKKGRRIEFNTCVRFRKRNKTIVLLDGTTRKWLAECLFPEFKYHLIHLVNPVGRVIQYMESFYSKEKVVRSDDTERLFQTIRSIVEMEQEKPKSIDLITYKDIAANEEKQNEWKQEIDLENINFGHFGGVEGSNQFKGDILLVVGALRANLDAVKNKYEALYCKPAPQAKMEWRWLLTSDGKWDTYEQSIDHPALRKIAHNITERSLVQAVGRARHVFAGDGRPSTPRVYLFCHHPVRIVGLERRLCKTDSLDFLVADILPRLNNGDRVDIIEAVMEKQGCEERTAQKLTKAIVARLEKQSKRTLTLKRSPRGYAFVTHGVNAVTHSASLRSTILKSR